MKISETKSSIEMDSDNSESSYYDSENESMQSEVSTDEEAANQDVKDEDEAENEVVRAIIRGKEIQRDHPPNINCEDYVVDISFHPEENILAAASITGDVFLYKYTNEENTLMDTYELHLKACRDIEFDNSGRVLFSTAKDKAIMLTDVSSGKLIKCYEDAHDAPVYCISVIDENLFASGDDDGNIRLWDIRQKNDKCIFSLRKNEDYISDIITNEEKKILVCSSGDGSLTTINLVTRFLEGKYYPCQ